MQNESEAARRKLMDAIYEHYCQKADDRCWEDDDKLYAAAGLPIVDRGVGDKHAMLWNCARFIERRCAGGSWPTYVELEAELAMATTVLRELVLGADQGIRSRGQVAEWLRSGFAKARVFLEPGLADKKKSGA